MSTTIIEEVSKLTNLEKIELAKFPYYVIYKLGKKIIYIFAVYHNKRNDTWKKRLH